MGGLVEKQIADAMRALVDRDVEVARQAIERDQRVDQLEIELDEACIRILALHQPAARDLRLVTTALKISTDLERIGDQAENICERAIELAAEPRLKPYVDLPRMGELAQKMVRECLDAYVREDAELALRVCHEDDEMDALTDQVSRELVTYMAENPAAIARAMRLSFIAKYLERIGDHATNIAEMVVYMVTGKSIRHLEELPAKI